MTCFGSISALGGALVLAAGGDPVLTIGTEASFPPYVLTDGAGGLTGFDHDVMAEVCSRIRHDCQWQTAAFEELIPGVASGRFDLAVGGIAITPERRAWVDFSDPYAPGGAPDWYVGAPGAPLPQDAQIAVESGTVQETWLRDQGLSYRIYPSESAVLDALATGAADLAFGPFDSREDLSDAIFGQGFDLLYSVDVPDEGVGIVVCRGNAPLLQQINDALSGMWQDGTLQDLDSRWF